MTRKNRRPPRPIRSRLTAWFFRAAGLFRVARLLGAALFLAGAAWPGIAAQDKSPPLPAPQWVGATDRGGKAVLTWIRDPRIPQVRIYRSSPGPQRVFVPIKDTRDNTFTDTAVALGQTYHYRLVALGVDGKEGPPSREISVRIAAVTAKQPAPPSWEGYLAIENGVGLKWGEQEGADVIAYNIYRKSPPDTEFQLVASVRGTSYADTGLDPGRLYIYALTALDSSFKETAFSPELTVKYQPEPAPLEKGKKAEPVWRLRRTRLVAMITGGTVPFLRPVDVGLGPVTGNIYLADSGRNRVFVFNAKGEFLRFLGGAAGSLTAFRRLLGITVDRMENIYAVDSGQATVLTFSHQGGSGRRIEIPRPIRPAAPGLIDCAVGADGRVFIVDNTNNRVSLVGREGSGSVFGTEGYRAGEFSAPTFCATDAGGYFYVADSLNARVQVFTASGEFVLAFGRYQRGVGGLGRPKGIALQENGEIYVADSWQNTVQVFDPAGEFLALLADENGVPLDLGSPNGIALGPGNRIYIAERLTSRLQIREILPDDDK